MNGRNIPNLTPTPWVSLTRTLHEPRPCRAKFGSPHGIQVLLVPSAARALFGDSEFGPLTTGIPLLKCHRSLENALFRPITGLSSDRATFG